MSKRKDVLLQGALQIQKSTFDEVNGRLSSMNLGFPLLTPENYEGILRDIPELAPIKAQLDGIVQFTNGIRDYMDGVADISLGAADLSIGISELNSSISKIPKLANDLYNGGVELNLAVEKLKMGLIEYKQGTNRLKNGTLNIDDKISNTIDNIMSSMLGDDDEIVSFVSDKNTNVSSVQFVIKTDEIKKSETETVKREAKKPSFWERLLDLFGLRK